MPIERPAHSGAVDAEHLSDLRNGEVAFVRQFLHPGDLSGSKLLGPSSDPPLGAGGS